MNRPKERSDCASRFKLVRAKWRDAIPNRVLRPRAFSHYFVRRSRGCEVLWRSNRIIEMNFPSIYLFLLASCLVSLAAEDPAALRYYELRIYDVTTNQMDGVRERFRETVEPVRRKHGIKTEGYWTAPGNTNGGVFVYLMSAPNRAELQRQEKDFGADPEFKAGYAASNAKHGKTVDQINALPLSTAPDAKYDFTASKIPRGFDLRIYSVLPGKLDAFRNRWRDFAVPIYERHGLHSLGWWVAEKKDADLNDQFVCLLAGDSIAAIRKAISEFHQDSEWQRVEQETEANGKLRSGVTAYKLTPADFSSIK